MAEPYRFAPEPPARVRDKPRLLKEWKAAQRANKRRLKRKAKK